MTAYEIYRVRTALRERVLETKQYWEKLKDCDDPEKANEKEAAEDRFHAAQDTLWMYDRFRF